MPRTRRQNIQLRHEQILDALSKAVDYLNELHEAFSKHHPEYAPGYESIIIMVVQAHEFVSKMKDLT